MDLVTLIKPIVMALFTTAILAVAALVQAGITPNPYDSMPKSCREKRPVSGNYVETGRRFQIDDMDIYETGDKELKNVLIAAYDIFGFHPNTIQVADMMAEKGPFLIAMPDFFRGKPYLLDDYAHLASKLSVFLENQGNYADGKKALIKVLNHYKSRNITNFALYGQCWGGWLGSQATGELNDLKAVGLVHSWGVTEEFVNNMLAPAYFMPASDDPNMVPLYEKLKRKFGDRCGHHRFEDMTHGFTSARGNFSDPLIFKRVHEVVSMLIEYFNDIFKQT